MMWLILSIVSSTLLFVLFEWVQKHKINLFTTIVINYVVCSICGNLLLGKYHLFSGEHTKYSHIGYIVAMGALFIGTFFLMGFATAHEGASKSSVASKMSVIVPVLISILLFKQGGTGVQYAGILLGLVSVYFITKKHGVHLLNSKPWILLAVFVGSGMVDAGLNLLGHYYGSIQNSDKFISTFIFTSAAAIGILVYAIKFRTAITFPSLAMGVILGLVNYFSLLCVFNSLAFFKHNTAYYWMVNNIGVVLASTLVSVLFFGRKLDQNNYIGLAIAIAAIVALNW